jgi:sulfate/thiosulfate transport system substrate-binding protein
VIVRRARWASLLVVFALIAIAAGVAGCGNSGDAGDGSSKLTLVAYSTPREAYEAVIPQFQATPAGKDVTFEQSYGSSGEQSRAVEAGLAADVVAFSLEPDMSRLVDSGQVAPDWNGGPHKGIVTDSVVVLAVRKGNPKNIRTWDDLLRDDVDVITPNIFTSGGAKWNTMAAYGAQIEAGKTPAQALEYLTAMYKNVKVQDKSARESLQTFVGGTGDVLVAYENEAILAQKNGEEIDYVVPAETILIENPIAAVSKSKNEAAAKAFVTFLGSDAAQKTFGEQGYRPVVASVAAGFDFPTPPKLFTIADLGGWSKVNDEFFDRENGSVSKILLGQGVPTE